MNGNATVRENNATVRENKGHSRGDWGVGSHGMLGTDASEVPGFLPRRFMSNSVQLRLKDFVKI